MKQFRNLMLCLLLLPGVLAHAQDVGNPAPDFTYDVLEGESFTLSDQLGKVVVMFSFGFSCRFCVASGPYVQEGLVEHYAENGDVVLIGLDLWNGAPGSVATFRSNTGLTMPLLLKAGSFGNTYSIEHDRLLVVDRQGILTYRSSTDAGSNVANAVAATDAALSTPVSVETTNENNYNFSVYPNPTNGYANFSFNLPDAGEVSIRIISLDGRTHIESDSLTLQAGERKMKLDVSSLAPGVYLSVLQYGGTQNIEKFVVN